jgi:hypothetical protein
VSQVEVSLVPTEQIWCAQVPLAPHWPELLQVCPLAHDPQVPPQPSLPQVLPEQEGVQLATHWPELLQVCPLPHDPQAPPQPSLPQVLPVQAGVQLETHWPELLHVCPLAHDPQVPLQPSLPQDLPEQEGVHELPFRAVPLGVPMPVGPSQPAPDLHSTLPHEPLLPEVTSKKEPALA